MLLTKNAHTLLNAGTTIILPSVAAGLYHLPGIIDKAERGELLTMEDTAHLRELRENLNSLWLNFMGVVNAVQAAGSTEQTERGDGE